MNASNEKKDQEQLKEKVSQIPDLAVEVFTGYGIFRIDKVSQHDLEQAKLKFEEAIRETLDL
jgi:predicted house-cleaning NTP pyrophosphatase (Maf/HAM1 superfamily)